MERDDAPELGRLMADSHLSLRDDFEVSAPALDAIVMRCLALDPAARYATVDALLADLEGLRA